MDKIDIFYKFYLIILLKCFEFIECGNLKENNEDFNLLNWIKGNYLLVIICGISLIIIIILLICCCCRKKNEYSISSDMGMVNDKEKLMYE
jgi:hypothetical protein